MQEEIRTTCYDSELNLEAYNFKGVMQKFPSHFHEYYVLGFIENGQRSLYCKNKNYIIGAGDLILLNPNDIHSCEQLEGALDYRCLNISKDVMKEAVTEISEESYLPYFKEPVLHSSDITGALQELHVMIMRGDKDFKKEEIFLFIIQQIIYENTDSKSREEEKVTVEIQKACDYIEKNYMNNITLKDLTNYTGLSKYYLIRCFTRQKGISPYSYLETIRISKAKKLLENQVSPMEAAILTGFSDQSHFTNFFKKFIGLTPKQYMNIFID
ncbi:MAG: AraC family transcriptional regulator [Solirubrobacterales bacterium]